MTVRNYGAETKIIWKDIDIWDKLQRLHVDCSFGPTKAKIISVEL